MKRLLILAGTFVAAAGMLSYRPVQAETEVNVCHLEDKKSDQGHIIAIPFNALGAHTTHGDETWTNLPVGSACVVDGDPNT
jgi:hypothetical protein